MNDKTWFSYRAENGENYHAFVFRPEEPQNFVFTEYHEITTIEDLKKIVETDSLTAFFKWPNKINL